jgi:hypothetical protein
MLKKLIGYFDKQLQVGTSEWPADHLDFVPNLGD